MFRVARAGRRGGPAVSSRRLCGGPGTGGEPAIAPNLKSAEAQHLKARPVPAAVEGKGRICERRPAEDCDGVARV